MRLAALTTQAGLVCDDTVDGELVVDAAMPNHNHGMNHVPLIERTGPGRWHVEDMLFHMPGYWELYFDVEEQGVTHRAQEALEVD